MEAALADWLNLLLRWAHVITGIAWIGSSFFFNWLDSHIEAPTDGRKIEGDLWMVHSGGFYNMVKMDLAPDQMPPTLHWVKWEAGFTFITGFFLLVLVYYVGASVYLMPTDETGLGVAGTIGVGLAVVAGGWAVYDALWKTRFAEDRPRLAALISFALLVLLAWALPHALSERATYLHLGAMMGTIMAANVWMCIVPAQRELVEATREGRRPDPAPAIRAKTRSLHNNYMTLPVVLLMFSGHYPGTFGHDWAWAILALLVLAGAAIRHVFNLRNKGRHENSLVYAALGGVLLLSLLGIWTAGTMSRGSGAAVAFAEAHAVIERHCVACHSARPTMAGIAEPPKGVTYDTPAEIKARAPQILAQAVHTDAMPPGNPTGMTEVERALLADWIAAGAPIEGDD